MRGPDILADPEPGILKLLDEVLGRLPAGPASSPDDLTDVGAGQVLGMKTVLLDLTPEQEADLHAALVQKGPEVLESLLDDAAVGFVGTASVIKDPQTPKDKTGPLPKVSDLVDRTVKRGAGSALTDAPARPAASVPGAKTPGKHGISR